MFVIKNIIKARTIDEAYDALVAKRSNTILGGCAFLRLGSKMIDTGIDLSELQLNYIKEEGEYIEIGAMTTFRDIEVSPILNECFSGVLPKSVENIIGVQFRNLVTVGASVYSKYGFSDFITGLLTLDTEVELYKGGRMSLEDFLKAPYEKDILVRLFIKKNDRKAVYKDLRNSISDFPILNASVSKLGDSFKIVVGARPQRAMVAEKASLILEGGELTPEKIEEAARIASEELKFGSNMRGTEEYRKAVCKSLVKRGIMEVLVCR